MAVALPLNKRPFTGVHLSDVPGVKLILYCEQCDLRRQYDGDALFAKLDEDCNFPTLLTKLRKAIKCERALKYRTASDPQCKLYYDILAMWEANKHIPAYAESHRGAVEYLRQTRGALT